MKRLLFGLLTLAIVLSMVGVGSLAYLSDTETSTGSTFTAGIWPIEVGIDINPGSNPNSINPDSEGLIPVAILTTPVFDAYWVAAETVSFGPDLAWPENWAFEDVDGDGDQDMILHFRTQDTGLRIGDTEAKLVGKTLDGLDIYGSDSVRIVPPEDEDGD